MLELAVVDYVVIVTYFVMLFSLGFFIKRKVHDLNDYFLAGRRLTLPIFVATLASTWYGGLLGVGELSFNYGLVNWLIQGFFWYLVYLFFAFFWQIESEDQIFIQYLINWRDSMIKNHAFLVQFLIL